MPEEVAIILFFDLSSQLRNTKDLVFFIIDTYPIISSLNLVGATNFISKDMVTHGFPFEEE